MFWDVFLIFLSLIYMHYISCVSMVYEYVCLYVYIFMYVYGLIKLADCSTRQFRSYCKHGQTMVVVPSGKVLLLLCWVDTIHISNHFLNNYVYVHSLVVISDLFRETLGSEQWKLYKLVTGHSSKNRWLFSEIFFYDIVVGLFTALTSDSFLSFMPWIQIFTVFMLYYSSVYSFHMLKKSFLWFGLIPLLYIWVLIDFILLDPICSYSFPLTFLIGLLSFLIISSLQLEFLLISLFIRFWF